MGRKGGYLYFFQGDGNTGICVTFYIKKYDEKPRWGVGV
jgi:hypothetical protein